MMIAFCYLCFLLFIIIFLLYLQKINVKFCPNKIKIYYTITLALLFLRYSTIFIASLANNQAIVYFIRPIAVLNYCAIPLLALGALYIFLREERRGFDYNFIFMAILLVVDITLILLYKVKIDISINFGFVIGFREILTPNLIYLIILASLAVITLMQIDRPYCNRGGMRLLLISLMCSVAELILFLGGIKVFPYPIFGEVLILLNTFNAINTFYKK